MTMEPMAVMEYWKPMGRPMYSSLAMIFGRNVRSAPLGMAAFMYKSR